MKKVIIATTECHEWFRSKLEFMLPRTSKVIEQGHHPPALFMYSKDGFDGKPEQCAVIPVSTFGGEVFGSGETKNVVARLQRMTAEVDYVRGVIFVVEAWYVEGDQPLGDDISEHPDKKEAVMFNLLYHDDSDCLQQLMATYPILRPSNTLGEPMITDPHAAHSLSHGRFISQSDKKDGH
jgi:hypothetical protein